MLEEVVPTDVEVEGMTPRQFKTYESKVRRAAKRQGLTLVKSRRRDPRAADYRSYWLMDERTRWLVAGGEFGWFLNEVHARLVSDDHE